MTGEGEAYRVTTAEGKLVLIECSDSGKLSDGYHTMAELYGHRRALTAALCKALSLDAWRSKAHHPEDSPMFEGGYFIVGINLPTGTITYHYKLSHWDDFAGVIELEHAPKWDGAAPDATVDRLLEWTRG
ncbi:Pas24 [Actinoplanes phage phiAsp2]|uniref:Pas24 n=1 Tax=Actinoplanes phage phiAsp2 TaxID=279303 RepID=Q6J807_9CAUD|nr:Pas24 [Actinoplanes phage phiAsp2]AAT36772.1 Pas24 [Actinoplanes phage phiAsp2]